jgi:hypothetical protein
VGNLLLGKISQAGASGLTDVIGAYERNRTWISRVPTHSFWFSRFISGIHKRVGGIRRQDEPIGIEVLHCINKILESEWQRGPGKAEKKRIAEMGIWVIGGFCTGLRGEEMLQIELAGTVNSLKFMRKEVDPYFMFVVSGRTKGNQLTGASKFGVPCISKTLGTGIRPGRWIGRLSMILKAEGIRSGRLFRRRLDPSSLCEWEDDFFTLLEQVQSTMNLIDEGKVVRDGFGIMSLTRRGVTIHARNMRVDEDIIKTVNRWMKGGGTGAARLDMIEPEALAPLYVRYSLAL